MFLRKKNKVLWKTQSIGIAEGIDQSCKVSLDAHLSFWFSSRWSFFFCRLNPIRNLNCLTTWSTIFLVVKNIFVARICFVNKISQFLRFNVTRWIDTKRVVTHFFSIEYLKCATIFSIYAIKSGRLKPISCDYLDNCHRIDVKMQNQDSLKILKKSWRATL